MVLQKFQFKPGVNTDIPSYANEFGWEDGDKIRFRSGYPEKIGGWSKKGNNEFIGSVRALKSWQTLDLDKYLGVGSHLKYFIEVGDVFHDITPIRHTTAAGDVTFAATNGSSTITVTDVSHDARENDFVTFSGAASLGGTITADVLNQEYQITKVNSNNEYEFNARTANTDISDYYSGGVVDDTLGVKVSYCMFFVILVTDPPSVFVTLKNLAGRLPLPVRFVPGDTSFNPLLSLISTLIV